MVLGHRLAKCVTPFFISAPSVYFVDSVGFTLLCVPVRCL